MKKLLIFISICCLLTVLIDCSWSTEPESQDEVYITCNVFNTGVVNASVSFAPVIPLITVNQETLDMCEYYCNILDCNIYYEDTVSVNFGDSVFLKVDFIKGIATASSIIPNIFGINTHDTSQAVIISDESILTVGWTSAEYADFYRLLLSVKGNYRSEFGLVLVYLVKKDTCISSNSITYDMNKLLPEDLDSIINVEGWLKVYAFNGPKIEPGSEGNVEGDGCGFLWCRTFGGKLNIRIEASDTVISEKITENDEKLEWFEKIRAIDPEYQVLKQM